MAGRRRGHPPGARPSPGSGSCSYSCCCEGGGRCVGAPLGEAAVTRPRGGRAARRCRRRGSLFRCARLRWRSGRQDRLAKLLAELHPEAPEHVPALVAFGDLAVFFSDVGGLDDPPLDGVLRGNGEAASPGRRRVGEKALGWAGGWIDGRYDRLREFKRPMRVA